VLKGIIFDFDGVIAESVKVKSDAFAELYKPYGPDVVRKVVDHHEANGGMSRFEKIKFYHELFLNKTITEEKITKLAKQFSDLVMIKVIASPYVPGALEYIQKSYDRYKLFISSGTPKTEMEQILGGRKIAKYFTDVFGSPEKKINHIKNIISKYNLNQNELLFIGDSPTDYHSAHVTGVKFILRLHDTNYQFFEDYNGKTIKNFKSLNI